MTKSRAYPSTNPESFRGGTECSPRQGIGEYHEHHSVGLHLLFITVAVIFIIATSYLSFATAPTSGERIFNSPDETANYYFTKNLTEQNTFLVYEVLNNFYGDIIHPRSTIVKEGRILPISFVGMIFFYALIAKLIGMWIVVYLTPIISLVAMMYFYKLLKEIFNNSIALLSILLLVIFPGWIYYNNRSMYHNVVFVDFLIIALYFFFKYSQKLKLLHLVLSALSLGLAITIRTSETIWILVLFLAQYLFYIKMKIIGQIKFFHVILYLSIIIMVFIPVLYYNTVNFGSPFVFGYTTIRQSGESFLTNEIQNSKIITSFLPFGFHPRRSILNFYKYYGLLFWWFFVPFIVGVVYFIRKWKERTPLEKQYFISFLIFAVYLIFFYGGWYISDNLDPGKITIGTSYVRYWLTLYVFSMPFIAEILFVWYKKIQKKIFQKIYVLLVSFFVIYMSLNLVYFKTEESIVQVKKRIDEYYEKRNRVSATVEPNSVIVTERSDKIFFPKYRVVSDIRGPENLKYLSNLVQKYPVYWYTFLNDHDVSLFESKLKNYNMKLLKKIPVMGNENLYKISYEKIQ